MDHLLDCALFVQLLGEYPLHSGEYADEEALFIHIIYKAAINGILDQLAVKKLEIESVFKGRICLLSLDIEPFNPFCYEIKGMALYKTVSLHFFRHFSLIFL